MRVGVRTTLACAAAASALVLSACGEDEKPGPVAGSRTLTVYSSLPLQGPSRPESQDMVDAMKLALSQAGGQVGELTVNYVSLDATESGHDTWTKDKVLDNARQAIRDPNAIAYLGDLDSAATALSLPLLNEGGVLQVSASSTYLGLTRPAAGRKGEPERFYPALRKTFGRVIPADDVQAEALVEYMRAGGTQRLYLLNDRDVYGHGLTEQVKAVAESRGVEIVGDDDVDPTDDDFSGPARKVAESGADAFLYGGSTERGAAKVYAAVGAGDPRVALFGGDAVAEPEFARALPTAIQSRMRITSPALPPRLQPPSARRFRRDFQRRFGRLPRPLARYAFEAMGVVLASVRGAGDRGNKRNDVVDAFYRVRNRRSVLGTYSIDRNGDTSTRIYAGQRIADSRLVFDRRFGG